MSPDEHPDLPAFAAARRLISSVQGNPYQGGTDIMELIEALELFIHEINAHPEVPVEELLPLLDFGGVIAEFAARVLYVRTDRDGLHRRLPGSEGLPFIIDRADWAAYLSTWREAGSSVTLTTP